MSDLAQPPEAVACLVTDVCPGGGGACADVAEPEIAGDQGVDGGGEDLALSS